MNNESTEEIVFISERDGNAEIYVMDANGQAVHNLTKNVAHDFAPVWSPNGQHIAFVSERDGSGDIYVMDADGGNIRRLTDSGDVSYPVWSPAGDRIAFLSRQDDISKINVMDANGNNSRNVATYPYFILKILWLNDGSGIIFSSANEAPEYEDDATYIVDVEGGDPRRLISAMSEDMDLSSSDLMSFASNLPGNLEIYSPELDGDNFQRLTYREADDFAPVWSPNGQYIVFVSGTLGDTVQLYVMDADGSNVRLLRGSSVWYDVPNWSSDSNQIVVTGSHTPPYESDGSSEIFLVDLGTGNIRNLTNNTVDDYSPLWRPHAPTEEEDN